MFNHFVALDFAMSNMALARMTSKSNKVSIIDVPSDLSDLKIYLKNLKGSIVLAFEETTTSRWLYTELNDHVDKIVICDPYRNKLLSEGAKIDKIDAEKLVKLLRADLLKEVYHSNNDFLELRKLVSSYEGLVGIGVKLKNRRSALFRAKNLNHKKEKSLESVTEKFILRGIDKQILEYEKEKERYLKEFKRLKKKHQEIRNLSEIPGIGDITSVQIVSRVVDAKRFKSRNHFFSYCGLTHHSRMSGGKSYGKKKPRYCRLMKSAFKIAVASNLRGENEFFERYNYLIEEKNYSARDARSAVCRYIAALAYGVLKSSTRYERSKNRRTEKIKVL